MQLGTAHGEVICPWDVPDLEHVPDQKIEFLLALHALLIGDAHDAEGLDPHPRRRRGGAAARRDQPPSTRAAPTAGSGRASSC